MKTLQIALISVIVISASARALTLDNYTRESALIESSAIIVGTVESIQQVDDPDDIFFDYFDYDEVVVRVTEVIKGDVPEVISVVRWGEAFVGIRPEFRVGETVLLGLSESKGFYSVIGLKKSKYDVTNGLVNGIEPVSVLKSQILELLNGSRTLITVHVEEGGPAAKVTSDSLEFYSDAVRIRCTESSPTNHIFTSITYKYNPDAQPADTTGIRARIGDAADAWNDETTTDPAISLSLSASETNTKMNGADSQNSIAWQPESWFADPSYLAVAQYGHFSRSPDVIFNNDKSWNFTSGSPSGGERDFQAVLTHEMGHNLNLMHSSVDAATMDDIYSGDARATMASIGSSSSHAAPFCARHSSCSRSSATTDCTADVPNPVGDDFIRYEPHLQAPKSGKASIRNRLVQWSDHVLFLGYDVHSENGKGKGVGTRTIYPMERPDHIAKSRILPAEQLPFEHEEDGRVWDLLFAEGGVS